MTRCLLLSAAVAVAAATAFAAEPAAPATRMTTPGKVLLADDLKGPLDKAWKVGKGRWDAADGAVRAAELKADMHGAVARRDLAFTDAVIRYSFKLDGAKATSLTLNGPKGHVCRVRVGPTGFVVQKDDQDGKNGPDTGAVLGKCDVAVKPGEWHTMVLELRGPEMLATLDGTHTAYGSHEAVAKPKANLGFSVGGETASFKGLTVWEATAKPGWEKEKEKLKAGKEKAGKDK